MTPREPPPMSPVLRALVDADSQRPGPSADDRTRVYAALGVSLGLIPAGAVVAVHAASAAAQATATAAAASSGTSAVAAAVGAASTVGRLALFIKAPLMSVGVGAMLGAALTAYVVKSPVARSKASAARRAVAASVLAAPRSAPAAPLVAEAAPEAAPGERPAAPEKAPVARPAPAGLKPSTALPRHATVSSSTSATDEGRASAPAGDETRRDEAARASLGALGAEQALLDPARAALSRGDGAAALARLELHERRFPSGALSQEREAMTIRALVLTGSRDRALGRAASFRARYPDSLLWPMIDATLRSPTLGARP